MGVSLGCQKAEQTVRDWLKPQPWSTFILNEVYDRTVLTLVLKTDMLVNAPRLMTICSEVWRRKKHFLLSGSWE